MDNIYLISKRMLMLFLSSFMLVLGFGSLTNAQDDQNSLTESPPPYAWPTNPIPGNKHVLIIGMDGLRGDSLQCTGCALTPHMDALITGGAFHNNVIAGEGQVTSSGPGWATVFTGFWAGRHGITSNSPSLVLQETHVFDLIKAAYPTAGIATVGDWENITIKGNLMALGVDDVYVNNDTTALPTDIKKNSQQATDKVIQWLSSTNAPTAIFYYLHNIDIHKHVTGGAWDPLNAGYKMMIEYEDDKIGQVLHALTSRTNYANEEWLIVVASDHGGIDNKHGGGSAEEKNAMVILNNNYLNPGHSRYCHSDDISGMLYQTEATTPHVLDFLGIKAPDGLPSPKCIP